MANRIGSRPAHTPGKPRKAARAWRLAQQSLAGLAATAVLAPTVGGVIAPLTSSQPPAKPSSNPQLTEACSVGQDAFEALEKGKPLRIKLPARTKGAAELTSGGKASCLPKAAWDDEATAYMEARLTAAEIQAVRGGKAKEPLQVYASLTHADGVPEKRAVLAFAELKRLGAFERSHLVIPSPTGSGWVNPVMVQAIELLTRGDVAFASLQYSDLPSLLSLHKLDEQREGLRVLYTLIKDENARREARGLSTPKVTAFGESLGAWGTQDLLLSLASKSGQAKVQAGDTFEALDIDHSVFAGTPAGSKFHDEVIDGAGEATAPGVGEYASSDEFVKESQDEEVDHVFLSHPGDPVVHTGLSLIWEKPYDWPKDQDWDPILSFLRMLKAFPGSTASQPGEFNRVEHVHTADLPDIFNVLLKAHVGAEGMKTLYEFLEEKDKDRRSAELSPEDDAIRRRRDDDEEGFDLVTEDGPAPA